MYANSNLWDACLGDKEEVQEMVLNEFKAYAPFEGEGFFSWSDRVTGTIELENRIATQSPKQREVSSHGNL